MNPDPSQSSPYHEVGIVAENMQRFGGSFVQFLGRALAHADDRNISRIKQAFPDYWEEYLQMGSRS